MTQDIALTNHYFDHVQPLANGLFVQQFVYLDNKTPKLRITASVTVISLRKWSAMRRAFSCPDVTMEYASVGMDK